MYIQYVLCTGVTVYIYRFKLSNQHLQEKEKSYFPPIT